MNEDAVSCDVCRISHCSFCRRHLLELRALITQLWLFYLLYLGQLYLSWWMQYVTDECNNTSPHSAPWISIVPFECVERLGTSTHTGHEATIVWWRHNHRILCGGIKLLLLNSRRIDSFDVPWWTLTFDDLRAVKSCRWHPCHPQISH